MSKLVEVCRTTIPTALLESNRYRLQVDMEESCYLGRLTASFNEIDKVS